MFKFSKEFQAEVLLQKLKQENTYIRASMRDGKDMLECGGSAMGQCYLISKLLGYTLAGTYKQTHDKQFCDALLHGVVSFATEIMEEEMHDA